MDQNIDNPSPVPENQPPQPEPQTPPQPESAEPQPQSTQVGDVSQDSKNMGMLCHLLGLFTSFIGPLVIWLIKKEDDKYVDSQGKEALNFQITVILAGILSGILSFVCIGIVLALAVSVCDLIFCIMACIAASKGEDYRYPVSLRLVK